jgi:hypothetical protein
MLNNPRRVARIVALVALSLMSAVALAACGGDDDSGPGNATSAAKDSATRSAAGGAAVARLFSQAGSAVDTSAVRDVADPTPDDTRFAKQICVAAKDLYLAVEKAAKDMEKSPTPDVQSMDDLGAVFAQLFAVMAEPLGKFVDDFSRAQPPKDLVEWHGQLVKSLRPLVDALKQGDLTKLADLSEDAEAMPEPPAAAMARVEKAAESVSECLDLANVAGDAEGLFGGLEAKP